MNILSLLSYTSALIGLFLAITAIRLNYRAIENRLFFLLSLCVAIWSFARAFVYIGEDIETMWVWYRISAIGWTMITTFDLHFILYLTGAKSLTSNRPLMLMMYAPSIVFLFKAWTGFLLAKEFIPNPDFGAAEVANSDSVWYYLFTLHTIVYYLFSVFALINWKKKTSLNIYKKQANIMLMFFTLPFMLTLFTNMVLVSLIDNLPAIAATYTCIFSFGIWYAITKYKFLVVTPEIAAKEIISKMYDIVILLDNRNKIIQTNNQAEKLFQYKEADLISNEFISFVNEKSLFLGFLAKFSGNKNSSLEINLNIINKSRANIPVKILCSSISNIAGDEIGKVLVIHDRRETLSLKEKNKELKQSKEMIETHLTQKNDLYKELLKSEQRIRKLSDNLPRGVIFQFVSYPDYRIQFRYISEKIKNMMGFKAEEIYENSRIFYDRIPTDDLDKMFEFQTISSLEGYILDVEIRYRYNDSNLIWFNVCCVPRDEEDHVIWDGFIIDITKRKQYEEQIKDLNKTLENKVNERTKELKQAKDKLAVALSREQELNRLKTLFILMISHEYRTPLTEIMSSSELIKLFANKNMNDEIHKFVDKIKSSVITMTKLMEDVITIERHNSGKLKYSPAVFDIVLTINDLLEIEKKEDTGIHIYRFNTDLKHYNIMTDPNLVKQILSNLFSNATKYSPDHSEIIIQLYRENSNTMIKVIDSGVGIAPEDMANLYTPFHKSKDSVGIKPGIGLGMAIVKSCVEAIKGKLHVDSEVGKGTTFTLSIPEENI